MNRVKMPNYSLGVEDIRAENYELGHDMHTIDIPSKCQRSQ